MSPSERLRLLADGADPSLILRVRSGFVVLGSSQYLPGYCLLLAYPEVESLNRLPEADRLVFLDDMALVGDAVQRVTECKRLNYSIYGNLDPFLHAHIWPRYAWESEGTRTLPPLTIPAEIRENPEHRFDPVKHQDLILNLRSALSAS